MRKKQTTSGRPALYESGSRPKTYKLPVDKFAEVNHRIKLLLMEYQINSAPKRKCG